MQDKHNPDKGIFILRYNDDVGEVEQNAALSAMQHWAFSILGQHNLNPKAVGKEKYEQAKKTIERVNAIRARGTSEEQENS